MARPREYDKRTSTAIRFRPHLHDELVRIARDRDLSVNWLVNRAVERYLADLPPMPDEPQAHVHYWTPAETDAVGRIVRHCTGCPAEAFYDGSLRDFVDRQP